MTIKNESTGLPYYTPSELKKMTNEEQQLLSLTYFTYRMTGSVNLPYKNNHNRVCRGCAKNNMYRNFELDTHSVPELVKELKRKTDNYININAYGKLPNSNANVNITHIAELYIDLDVAHLSMTIEDMRPKLLDKLKQKLEELIETENIPNPTMMIRTGRGYGLHYKYKEYIPVEQSAYLHWHNLLYTAILKRMEQLLLPELKEIDLNIDYRVRDRNRIARIAGTYNKSSQCYSRLESLGEFYSIEELQEAFQISDEDLFLVNTPTPKKSKKKLLKTITSLEKIKELSSLSEEILEYRPEDTTPPSVSYPIQKMLEFNVKCLDRLYKARTWIEGVHRERFLFIVYNCHKVLYGAKQAYDTIKELNQGMQQPLTELEIQYAVYHTDTHKEESGFHSDGFYLFYPQSIIQFLELSEELISEAGFLEASQKQESYKEHNRLSAERDRLIAMLFLQKGYSVAKIGASLPKKYECSTGTIRNTLKRLGFTRVHKGHAELFEQIDFENCRRYRRTTEEVLPETSGNETEKICQTFMETKIKNIEKNFSKKDFLSKTDNIELKEKRFVSEKAKELYANHLRTRTENDEAVRLNALTAICAGKNVVLLGGGGTGKTSLILDVFNTFSQEEKDVTWFVSSNGKAATALPNGQTIHSAFGLALGIYNPGSGLAYPKNIDKIKRIVIDEIGQVRADIFHYIMEIVRYASYRYNHQIQVILLGDFGQICPVVTGEEEEELLRYFKGKYAFYSREWDYLNLSIFHFKHSRRHTEKLFVEKLDELQFGSLDALHFFNCILNKTASNTAMYVCPTNRLVNRFNREKIEQFKTRIKSKAIITGTIDYSKLETKHKDLELSIGMRIMAVKNTKEFKNGMLGTILKINKKSIRVQFDEVKEPVKMVPYTFKQDSGTYTQYPLTYGYAITADKCQGMTLEEINIVPGYFAVGQVYTVLSRCTSLKGIHLLGKFKESELLVDEMALHYCV